LKCRQYNVKVFEIGLEDTTAFKEFIDANYELIKNHLLAVQGEMSDDIRAFLNERELTYLCNMELPLPKRNMKEFSFPVESRPTEPEEMAGRVEEREEKEEYEKGEAEAHEEMVKEEPENSVEPLQIIMTALRSGQYIEHSGDVLLTERINSGAKIAALGSVVALGKMEGDISAAGECIVVSSARKGNILFHGRRIDGEKLIHPLNLIKFSGDRITIKPIIKKEYN